MQKAWPRSASPWIKGNGHGQYRQIMTTSRGRNDQIVCADHLPLLRQFGINFGMNARGGDGKVQHADSGYDGFDEGRPALPALFRVGAVDSHQQFGHDHGADVDLLRTLPRRKVDRLAAFLEANEDVRVNHQSHGLASAGNSARMARTSWANLSASSPNEGRLRKNAFSSPTVRGDLGSAGVKRAITLSSRSRPTLTPST